MGSAFKEKNLLQEATTCISLEMYPFPLMPEIGGYFYSEYAYLK